MAQQPVSPKPKTERITLDIGGMTCASCSLRIEKSLAGLSGVGQAEVNLALEKANVTFDPQLVSPEDFVQAVTEIGYQVRRDTFTLFLSGMDEAPLREKAESVVRKMPGVYKVLTNPSRGTLTVELIRGLGQLESVRAALSEAGYQITGDDQAAEDPKQQEAREARNRLLFSVVFTVPVWIAMFRMFTGVGPAWLENAWLQFVTASVVQWGPGYSFTRRAWLNLRHRNANMDVLVATGTLAAWALSTVDVFTHGPLYFDSSATVITLILVGKYLEALAKGKTSTAINELLALRPKTTRVRQPGGEWLEVPVDRVQVGDAIQVLSGGRVPVDGRVVDGSGLINESMLTGEPEVKTKKVDDPVSAGTINQGDRSFVMRAEKVGRDTMLAQIVQTVEQAQAEKAPIQRFVDRVANVFVPVVIAIAIVTLVATGLITGQWIAAILHAIAVLVVACPCALGLATPTATMVGSGIGARHGILYRSGEALERVSQVNVVAFDKTGTITEGQPAVAQILCHSSDVGERDILAIAAALEKESTHPLAKAIMEASNGQTLPEVEGVYSEDGRGMVGEYQGQTVLAGNEALLADYGVDISRQWIHDKVDPLRADGMTVVLVARSSALLGGIAIRDRIREDAKKTIQRLKRSGITVLMLTGDKKSTADSVALHVGIDRVRAELSPVEKAALVEEEESQGRFVAMVGDGINDAPALARAHVGMAISSGSDIAMETADVTLIRHEVATIQRALDIGRRTMSKIRQNLFWALFYNVIGIPLAAVGVLSPMVAGAAMAFSSVSVVSNSLLLRASDRRNY